MIKLKIAEILNARGIDHHFAYLVRSGFSNHIAHKLLNQKETSVRSQDLENICRVLVCEPSDILYFYPDDKYPLPQHHPLNKLIKDESKEKEFNNILKNLPYSELKNLSNHVHKNVRTQKEKPDTTAELS